MMKRSTFSIETLITTFGVFTIFAIAISEKFDFAWVLIILGIICLLNGMIKIKKRHLPETNHSTATTYSASNNVLHKPLLQIVLGALILAIGIIQLTNVQLPQKFWNAFMIAIVLIAIAWCFFKRRI